VNGLPIPNLDDRSFRQLLDEARARLQQSCPEWTDLSPSDPGMVLLELFAYLTETMIYRLNRLPEKVYVELLRLIGVQLEPPRAAGVMLRFTRRGDSPAGITIPRGTRVSVARTKSGGEAPTFTTSATVTLPPDSASIDVLAHHCDLIQGELAGKGTGLPGLRITASRSPITGPTGSELDLVVGVEASPGELDERVPGLIFDGKPYRIWREVDSFANPGSDLNVYIADRMAGAIIFAPAIRVLEDQGGLSSGAEALAAVPASGREIRLWYRCGGGRDGNVAAHMITVMKDSIAGIEVDNREPATGGRAEESVENALARGPQTLHTLERALTARDFEVLALESSGAVSRARAFTKAALWAHAAPGTVEVLLVPHIPEQDRPGGRVTFDLIAPYRTEEARRHIEVELDERRPMAMNCLVNWASYKSVRVKARVVARREEDTVAIARRVADRLNQTINPLPTALHPAGWRYGQALRASHVFDMILREAGVSYVDTVRLEVEEVPEKDVHCLAADNFQPRTWFAGAGGILYRSLDDGEGWEPAGRFTGESIVAVAVNRDVPGLVAVVTNVGGDAITSSAHFSTDCGETWRVAAQTSFGILDITWINRNGEAILLLASVGGLYEIGLKADAVPLQILVDSSAANRGLFAVSGMTDVRGQVCVAAAQQNTGGVFLSTQGGKPGTFQNIGLKGEDVRVLEFQYDGPRTFLWAGMAAEGGDEGKGCARIELLGSNLSPDGWRQYGKGWKGGSNRAIAFAGLRVMAASYQAGVLWLDSGKADPSWEAPDIGCGLPQRDVGRVFYKVDALASNPAGTLVLAGGPTGVYRTANGGVNYDCSSSREFAEKVTLPQTWLFCSGEHSVTVVSEDETDRD
jgi:Baseplate J-like protein